MIAALRQAVIQWSMILLSVLAIGPAVALLVAGLRSPTGGAETTLLWSASPLGGVLAGLAVLAAAGVFVAGAGLLLKGEIARDTGRYAAGLIVVWAAMRTGNVESLWRVDGDGAGGTAILLLIESLLVLVPGAAMALWLFSREHGHAEGLRRALISKAGLGAIGAGAIAAIVVSFVLVSSPLRGQAVAGTIGAAIAGGAAARAAATGFGATREPAGSAALAVLAAGLIAPVVMAVVPGLGGLHEAALAGTLRGPAATQPLDWLAAALIGAPIGSAWAASLLDQADQASAPATKRA